MNLLMVIRVLHIAAGATALLIMAVPLIAKKGGLAHRRAGFVFTRAMMVVAVTGLPLIAARIARDLLGGLFLSQIFLLTAISVWFGLRALKAKTPTPERHFLAERIGAAAALLASVCGLAFSVWRQAPVYAGFALLTAMLARQWLRFFSAPYRERGQWLLMHLTGMCTLCIAAVTAFTVTNARALGVPQSLFWVVWLGPPALGAFAIGVWQRKWRARMTAVG
jgi:uncharacterized membrane protein